jgi:hypothetical protein
MNGPDKDMFSNAFHSPARATNPRATFQIHPVKNIMDFAVFNIGEHIRTGRQGTPIDHFIPVDVAIILQLLPT